MRDGEETTCVGGLFGSLSVRPDGNLRLGQLLLGGQLQRKIKRGGSLLSVDGQTTTGMTLVEATNLVFGPVGSLVTLVVAPGDDSGAGFAPIEVTCIRTNDELRDIQVAMLRSEMEEGSSGEMAALRREVAHAFNLTTDSLTSQTPTAPNKDLVSLLVESNRRVKDLLARTGTLEYDLLEARGWLSASSSAPLDSTTEPQAPPEQLQPSMSGGDASRSSQESPAGGSSTHHVSPLGTVRPSLFDSIAETDSPSRMAVGLGEWERDHPGSAISPPALLLWGQESEAGRGEGEQAASATRSSAAASHNGVWDGATGPEAFRRRGVAPVVGVGGCRGGAGGDAGEEKPKGVGDHMDKPVVGSVSSWMDMPFSPLQNPAHGSPAPNGVRGRASAPSPAGGGGSVARSAGAGGGVGTRLSVV